MELTKPELKLVGESGNAFAILGKAQRIARESGWEKEKIDKFMKKATAGNYDHLLATCMKFFDVI